MFSLLLLHSNVRTNPILSNFGFKYFILFVDDFSQYAWIFPMKRKTEVPYHFHNLRLSIEKLCNAYIRCLQTVGDEEYVCFWPIDEEFVNRDFYLITHHICHRLSCLYTPSQNGLVECNVHHLIKRDARCSSMRSCQLRSGHKCYPNRHKPSEPSTIVHVIFSYFFQCPFGITLVHLHLRVFVCLYYPLVLFPGSHKLNLKVLSRAFIGYASNMKDYHCLNHQACHFHTTHNI